MTTFDDRTHYWHGRLTEDGPPTITSFTREGGEQTTTYHDPPDTVEVEECDRCSKTFYRRTDRRPEERPTVCKRCYTEVTYEGYEEVAAAFLDAAFDDDRVASCHVSQTGGGCHAIEISFAGQSKHLQILVGDGDNGPLDLDGPPVTWGASMAYWDEDEDNCELWSDGDQGITDPVDMLNVLYPEAMRASKGRAERDAMAAEEAARWERRRAELEAERSATVAESEKEEA